MIIHRNLPLAASWLAGSGRSTEGSGYYVRIFWKVHLGGGGESAFSQTDDIEAVLALA
jgi:hypothetical protein